MSTTELSRILSRIETMETELAALRKQAQQVLKAHGAKVRSEADTAPKRVNGYTLYIKQGGKRDKWKKLSDATKQKYAKQAKEMNEKVAKPRYVKALDKIVGLWDEDLQVYKAPKGRPPKDSVWDQDGHCKTTVQIVANPAGRLHQRYVGRFAMRERRWDSDDHVLLRQRL